MGGPLRVRLVNNGGPLQSDSIQATVPVASNLTEDIFGIDDVVKRRSGAIFKKRFAEKWQILL